MKTVSELYRYFDSIIPIELRSDWDNDGSMCAYDAQKSVSKILFALDVTNNVIDYAVASSFDLIVTHHPLIFKPLKTLNYKNVTESKIIRLLKNDVSVFSFHTRLDALEGGVNDVLADIIGLRECEAFGPEDEKIGRVGIFDQKLKMNDFCCLLKSKLNAPCLQIIDSGRDVSKVALLGGSGKDFLQNAIEVGADTYLTGEMNYNTMSDAADMGINVVCAGHYYTELPVLEKLVKLTREFDDTITTEIFVNDPVKYI